MPADPCRCAQLRHLCERTRLDSIDPRCGHCMAGVIDGKNVLVRENQQLLATVKRRERLIDDLVGDLLKLKEGKDATA